MNFTGLLRLANDFHLMILQNTILNTTGASKNIVTTFLNTHHKVSLYINDK